LLREASVAGCSRAPGRAASGRRRDAHRQGRRRGAVRPRGSVFDGRQPVISCGCARLRQNGSCLTAPFAPRTMRHGSSRTTTRAIPAVRSFKQRCRLRAHKRESQPT
jgi:hypothetical protein